MSTIWGRVARVAAVGGVVMVLAGGALAMQHAMHEARIKHMKTMGGHLGAIGKVAKGEMDYSADTVAQAEALQEMTQKILEWFPKGSIGPEDSRAKPEIWTDWDTFKQKAMDLQAAVPALVAATKTGDKAQIGAALKGVGKTCGGCHKMFRKPKKK